MPDKTAKKHKHLTLDDREEIQGCLNHGMTFKAIGQRIGKDQITVSKEVKRHLVSQSLEHQSFDSQGNLLPPEPCPRHLKPPFCCNPCEKKNRLCAFQKRYYHAKPAQKAYESLLVEARDGVPLGRESFYQMDEIIARQMKKGQHLYHILQTQDLAVSKSSVYRYLHKGYLSAGKMDFPRVVKFKPRQPCQQEYIPAVRRQRHPHLIVFPQHQLCPPALLYAFIIPFLCEKVQAIQWTWTFSVLSCIRVSGVSLLPGRGFV